MMMEVRDISSGFCPEERVSHLNMFVIVAKTWCNTHDWLCTGVKNQGGCSCVCVERELSLGRARNVARNGPIPEGAQF